MTPEAMERRIVRYGELVPCRTAFIDAHTPGSDKKENFTIIGAGVSESPEQHVHIRETPGFNIGAAGQPPKCRNSLHAHRTAEVFFVLKGRWRFFWGRWGTAGEVVLEQGQRYGEAPGRPQQRDDVGQRATGSAGLLGSPDAGQAQPGDDLPQVPQQRGALGLQHPVVAHLVGEEPGDLRRALAHDEAPAGGRLEGAHVVATGILPAH